MFFFFQQNENWFATLTKVAILKTKLLAGNDHVKTKLLAGNDHVKTIVKAKLLAGNDHAKIWKISHCVFSVSYCQLYNNGDYDISNNVEF